MCAEGWEGVVKGGPAARRLVLAVHAGKLQASGMDTKTSDEGGD
jgi:hypothetical protein